MRILRLPLESKWFYLTEEGIKKEDYRLITPYFCNKLLLFNGEEKSINWWQTEFFDSSVTELLENINLFCSFKTFQLNRMTLGYPKSTDYARILNFEHKGIKIGKGNPLWGAVPNKYCFIIEHGSIQSHNLIF
jgi:hypothetical protein